MTITVPETRGKLGRVKLIGSGWKPVSMVDVYNSVTFTLWLCGCNLRCPFCHNWRLAINDIHLCHRIDVGKLLEDLGSAKPLIDYLHITGGEPLTQYRGLMELLTYVRDSIGVDTSINTNFTLYKPLEKILGENLVDHLATDLKIPYHLLYGYSENIAGKLWRLYLKTLSLVAEYNTPLELRIPVAKGIDLDEYVKYGGQAIKQLEKHSRFYIIIQPLLGPPITTPRNEEWCREYCDPGEDELDRVAGVFKKLGVDKIIVRKTLSLG